MSTALAIAAHPDDVEFTMAGTLLLLRQAGWDIHVINLSSGDLGSISMGVTETARARRREARKAARVIDATWHPPICRDLQIFYDDRTLRRVCSVIREVQPTIILTHSPEDYLEDHVTTCRLAVTAAFARGAPNYRTIPARESVHDEVTIYHATPHGMRDGLRRFIIPGAFVDTSGVHDQKRTALACHVSQKEWLDATQGMDSYLAAMESFSRAIGKLSGRFRHSEGWRRHLHIGLGEESADPLRRALTSRYLINPEYEVALETGL